MALEYNGNDAQSFYYRYNLGASSSLVLDLSGGGLATLPAEGMPFTYYGVAWHIEPTDDVSVEYFFGMTSEDRYDPEGSSHWHDHEVHATVDEVTGFLEEATIGAIRFSTGSGGGALIELRSPYPVTVEEN